MTEDTERSPWAEYDEMTRDPADVWEERAEKLEAELAAVRKELADTERVAGGILKAVSDKNDRLIEELIPLRNLAALWRKQLERKEKENGELRAKIEILNKLMGTV